MTFVLVVCDVWDTHWCASARRQADALAPAIDDFATRVRDDGGIVIHAPSQTDRFYESTEPYRRAQAVAEPWTPVRDVPAIELERHRARCPCQPACSAPDPADEWPWPWRRQHPAIAIDADDWVACDNGDAVIALARRSPTCRVGLCGLHLDQCVVDRPFGAKALWAAGVDVVILEDLTATFFPSDLATALASIASVIPVMPSTRFAS